MIRNVLDLAIRRLSPGDFYAGDAAPEITVLRDIAGKVTGEARTDVFESSGDPCGSQLGHLTWALLAFMESPIP